MTEKEIQRNENRKRKPTSLHFINLLFCPELYNRVFHVFIIDIFTIPEKIEKDGEESKEQINDQNEIRRYQICKLSNIIIAHRISMIVFL